MIKNEYTVDVVSYSKPKLRKGTSMPFESQVGPPNITLKVNKDGKLYEITCALAILDVLDLDKINADNNLPEFSVRAALLTDVKLC